MAGLDLRRSINIGLIFGMIALSMSAIGMVETFDERDIITGRPVTRSNTAIQFRDFGRICGCQAKRIRERDEKPGPPFLMVSSPAFLSLCLSLA